MTFRVDECSCRTLTEILVSKGLDAVERSSERGLLTGWDTENEALLF